MKYIDLIPTLKDVARHYLCKESPLDITVGYNPETEEWDYQLGDNSYSGPVYMFPVWAVSTLSKDSNLIEVARDLFKQIEDQSEYYELHYLLN